MAIKRCFKSHIISSKYHFKNGKEANFINGEFYTNIDSEIAELEAEIENGHAYIYIDKERMNVDTEKLDPISEIKRKAVEEYIALQEAATKGQRDMGNTEPQKLNPANSTTIAPNAPRSDGATSGARLVTLKK